MALGREPRRFALEDAAQLDTRRASSPGRGCSRSCMLELSGFAYPATTNVPLPPFSITPFDSSIRSASRTDERPDRKTCVNSRSVGRGSPRAQVPLADPPQQLVGDQLVDLLALDRLVAHRRLFV